MRSFLKGRDVAPRLIWLWRDHGEQPLRLPLRFLGRVDWTKRSPILGLAFFGAVAIAGLAIGYLWAIHHIPAVAEYMDHLGRNEPGDLIGRFSFIFLAVICAPLAEEYLFRGLLYRALDREWGGWKALWGSALFFTIYHQPIAWLPVMLAGLFHAWLFKISGRLLPCVLAHFTYNSMMTILQSLG
jgi:membrane protease YdiL (CAAX protease family)